MTASKTPNLGLMNPVGSDAFSTADFASTFSILDQNPGVLVVANQAARPTGWTANQHGRQVWQADQQVTWVWNQPSSTTAGVWVRTSGKGSLGGAGSLAYGNSVGITGSGSAILCEVDVLVPGGRPVLVLYSFLYAVNNDTGQTGIAYYENGTMIDTKYYSAYSYQRYPSTSHLPPGSGANYYVRYVAPVTQQSMVFQTRVVTNSGIGGGTSYVFGSTLDIIEI